jgi:hypothetical protein
MLSVAAMHAASSAAFVAPVVPQRASAVRMETKEELAVALNPAIGYFDPIGLADADFWGEGNAATWGFLREAEIKHGRVAMFAFCGYIAQANGLHFPYFLGEPTSGLTPEEQWFNLPVLGRAQIIAFIGFLEWWGEFGRTHYMRGGTPGAYPEFGDRIPIHKLPSLYDPLGICAKQSQEKKAEGLLKEINNGRLAMIGIMGFVAESKVPGAVPALDGLVKPFAGDVMAPLL